MAAGIIAIRNEEEGKAWVQKARELCEEAEGLMQQVAQTLKLVQDHSEGDIVVALVKAATGMLSFAQGICEAVQIVSKTIDGALTGTLVAVQHVTQQIVDIMNR